MMNRVEMNEKMMDEVVGGKLVTGNSYSTKVSEGYLALRNACGYDYSNEIGQLYNGSVVIVTGDPVGDYVPVTVVTQVNGRWTSGKVEGRCGYVNKNYLE